jgi:hypothetical protein
VEYKEFQKIPRLKRDMVISEKIDGTNSRVVIVKEDEVLQSYDSSLETEANFIIDYCLARKDSFCMFAGSKSRWIKPGKDSDNHGFASWVKLHAEELFNLGEGTHFGEYYGQSIQRTYGLDHKRFALFNTHRWKLEPVPPCCSVVPVLYQGKFDTNKIDEVLNELKEKGSVAVPGFMKPEGVVIYLVASRQLYKCTIDNDDEPKGQK